MSLVDDVIKTLRAWRSALPADCCVEHAYVFGSLIYLGGLQFSKSQSDVDILISLSDHVATPVARTRAATALARQKSALESSLRLLISGDAGDQLVSITLLSAFELRNNIHKDDKPLFWKSTFVSLDNNCSGKTTVENALADNFKLKFQSAVQVLRDAQQFRNQFLMIASDGTGPNLVGNETDAIPKKLCRAAAGLRYFVEKTELDSIADMNIGALYLTSLLAILSPQSKEIADLRNCVLARMGRGDVSALNKHQQLLLWEVLASVSVDAIKNAQAAIRSPTQWRPPFAATHSSDTPDTDGEAEFLIAATEPSIRIGDLNLSCKFFPASAWSPERDVDTFEDDQESERQIAIDMTSSQLPEDLLDRLIQEMEYELSLDDSGIVSNVSSYDTRDVLAILKKEGSNSYPRLSAMPRIVQVHDNGRDLLILRISLGPSRYGIALVEERRLRLKTAIQLRSQFILNSLAVRVAYVVRIGDEWWMEFHQRHHNRNSTFRGAWDVGAAGYIDAQNHRDPSDLRKISVWQAAAHELAEELGIPSYQLPHRDKYKFFGIGRNDQTGQLDLLGYCEGICAPSPNRQTAPRVSMYGRCRLTPRSVATFIAERKYWVPTALATIILTLRQYGFSACDIESEFSGLAGRVSLAP